MATKKYLDLTGTQQLVDKIKTRLDCVSALPSSPTEGDVVLLKTDNKLYSYDGSDWEAVGAVSIDKAAVEELFI